MMMMLCYGGDYLEVGDGQTFSNVVANQPTTTCCYHQTMGRRLAAVKA
jgi:hypothetical protein